jgi:hypothetical protein
LKPFAYFLSHIRSTRHDALVFERATMLVCIKTKKLKKEKPVITITTWNIWSTANKTTHVPREKQNQRHDAWITQNMCNFGQQSTTVLVVHQQAASRAVDRRAIQRFSKQAFARFINKATISIQGLQTSYKTRNWNC